MGEAKEHKMEMPRGYWMADRYAALLSSLNCKSVQMYIQIIQYVHCTAYIVHMYIQCLLYIHL